MHEARLLFTALALVLAMVLAEWVGRRQRVGAVILLLLSLVWFTADRLWEGGVLYSFSDKHGLTTSDLVGIAGLARGGWLLWRRRTRRT